MTSESNRSNNRSDSSQDNLQPDLQQIIALGQAASELLNNPIYNHVHSTAVNQAVQAWASTSPKEVQKRESLYQEVQALGRVAQITAGLVEHAQQAMKQQDDRQFNGESDYLSEQGFGLNSYQ